MHTIKLDINDKIFDKVMFFLKNIPTTELKIKEVTRTSHAREEDDIVTFFQSSPLVGELTLQREDEHYGDRVNF